MEINNQYDFFKNVNIDENGNLGVTVNGEVKLKQPFEFTATNYTELQTITGATDNDLAYVYNDEGTKWLPGSFGGTFYSKGLYVYSGGTWSSSTDGISYQFYLDDIRLDNLENNKLDKPDNLIIVDNTNDLPTASGGVHTLASDTAYLFTNNIDLNGNRLVGSANTTILGTSSESSSITSTGLGVGVPLFTTEWTTPVRHISFKDVDTVLDINGITNAPVALDWTGVNFVNVPNIGEINTCDNFIYTKGAFLNSKGLNFTGTHGTVAFNQSLFSGDGLAGSLISLDSGCTITRRFRIIYSSVISFGSTVGLDVNTGATIPVESYILDTVNFNGSGTKTTGITYLDNRTRWDKNKGIINTSEFGNYYMANNAVVTTIATSNTPYKISGTTTGNTINQKFEHSDNRLTYTGEIIRDFQVSGIVTFTTGNVILFNNKVIGLYIAKNGAVIPESEMYATSSGSGRAESISVQTVLQLQNNDYIEMWIENETDTTDVTVEYLNVMINSLN